MQCRGMKTGLFTNAIPPLSYVPGTIPLIFREREGGRIEGEAEGGETPQHYSSSQGLLQGAPM